MNIPKIRELTKDIVHGLTYGNTEGERCEILSKCNQILAELEQQSGEPVELPKTTEFTKEVKLRFQEYAKEYESIKFREDSTWAKRVAGEGIQATLLACGIIDWKVEEIKELIKENKLFKEYYQRIYQHDYIKEMKLILTNQSLTAVETKMRQYVIELTAERALQGIENKQQTERIKELENNIDIMSRQQGAD